MRHRALIGTAVGLALVLTACGGGDESTRTPAPTTAPEVTASLTPTPEPTPEVRWPQLGTARITTDDLNVRTGPGPQYLVLGRLQPNDEVPISGRANNGRWLAMPGVGWVAYDPTWTDLDVPWDELPQISVQEAGFEFVSPLHPLDIVVDIPIVDQVVNSVVQGDRTALVALAVTPEEPAEGDDEDATDDPPPTAACQDAVQPASELANAADDFFTSSTGAEGPLHLYAVTGAPFIEGEGGAEDVEAQFAAVFAFEGGEARQVWLGPEGGIRWFSLGCEPTAPGEMLRMDRGELFFWLRPVAPAPLDPVE